MVDSVYKIILDTLFTGQNKPRDLELSSEQKEKVEAFVRNPKVTSLIVTKGKKDENDIRILLSSEITSRSDGGKNGGNENAVVLVKVDSFDGQGGKKESIITESELLQQLREQLIQCKASNSGVLNMLSKMRKYTKVASLMEATKKDRSDLLTRVLDWAEESLTIESREEKELIDLITILRGKERKLKAVLLVCDSLFKDLDSYLEERKNLSQLISESSEDSMRLFRDWVKQAESVTFDKTRNCIEISKSTGEPEVTLDYKLVKMCRECRMLRCFAFDIPEPVVRKEQEVIIYTPIARELREIVHFYCTVGDQILLSQKPILLESAKKFTALLESREQISWSKDPDRLALWLEQLKDFAKKFNGQNKYLRQRHQEILSLILPLFEKPMSKWRSVLHEMRVVVQDIDDKFDNTDSWKSHWDHQLYKMVDLHFNDALLKADTWLGSDKSNLSSLLTDSSVTDTFLIDLCFINGSLVFRPPMEEIRGKMYSRIRKFLSLPHSFLGLTFDQAARQNNNNSNKTHQVESIFTAIAARSFLSYPIVYAKAADITKELLAIAGKFKEWTSLHSVIQSFGNNTAAFALAMHLDLVADYRNCLHSIRSRSQDFRKDFIENEYNLASANIVVNLTPVKSTVDWILSEVEKLIIKTLKDRTEFEARDLKREVSSILQRMDKAPVTIEELKDIESLLNTELPKINQNFALKFADIRDKSDFLKKWNSKLVLDETELAVKVDELTSALQSREQLINSYRQMMKATTESTIKSLSKAVSSNAKTWVKASPEMKTSQDFVAQMMQQINELESEFEKANEACDYFSIKKPSDFDEFTQLISQVKETHAKLSIINEFECGLKHLLDMEWIVARNKIGMIEHYLAKWQEDHPNTGAVIEERLKEWQEFIPILKLCRGECYARSHWTSLMSLLQLNENTVDGHVNYENVTLATLFSHRDKLFASRDFLKELNAQSVGETSVRETFNELDDFAATAKFTLYEYEMSNGSLVRLIKDWRTILNQLSECSLALQSVKGSEYFTNEFAEKGDQWQSRLTSLDSLINALNTVQRKWAYLEPIYGKQDSMAGAFQFPLADRTFSNISREFTEIMKAIAGDPHVVRLLRFTDLASKLREIESVLMACQKKLQVFMEESRNRFPRFYFLADDDLLLVLAGKSEISEVGLLKKLFNNCLVRLQFASPSASSSASSGESNTAATTRNEALDVGKRGKSSSSSKVIVAVESPEGEVITLKQPVSANAEQAEQWLSALESSIRDTLKAQLVTTLAIGDELMDMPLAKWQNIPSQVLSLCHWVTFTSKSEEAISGKKLRELKKRLESDLNRLTSHNLQQESPVTKFKVKSLILDTIHFLSVTDDLLQSLPRNVDDVKWLKHLRYYFHPSSQSLLVSMAEGRQEYSFEYLGCLGSAKLVHTPLTDDCFSTCMKAMSQGLGGNPFGPAGTGKTETIKALGQQLGRLVLVFNCDEAIDIKAMTRILVGLIKCGAWGCFDEFNRLSKSVLASLSDQIHAIQSALQVKSPTVNLPEFGEVDLSPNSAIFITLNPMGAQYKGRNELPDKLTKLFLPIAMTVPDILIIARVLLLAEGFDPQAAQDLGHKVIAWFNSARETMTKQKHYDWGLRAIKSVLNSAGRALRASNHQIDQVRVLVQSMRQQIRSKLVEEDEGHFDRLIAQIFSIEEDGSLLGEDAVKLHTCILKTMEKASLTPDRYQAMKALELDEQLKSRLGVVVLGESGVGKSTIWQILAKAKGEAEGKAIETIVMNPKAIPRSRLLGYIDEDTREWQDGLLPKKSREVARDEGPQFFWIILDGDIDPEWVEALNSVLDDNQVLTLPSGERIDFDSRKVNLIFEVTNLHYASPATISRLGIILIKGIKDLQYAKAVLSELNFPTSAEELMKSITWPQQQLRLSDTKSLLSQIRFSLSNQKDVRATLDQFEKRVQHSSSNSQAGRVGSLIITSSVSQVIEFVTPWIAGHEAILLTGAPGVGKNSILEETFFPQGLVIRLFCSPDMTPSDVICKIRECTTLVSSGPYVKSLRSTSGAKLILYLRNLDFVRADDWQSVAVIAFLVSLISYGGFWDEGSLEWLTLENFLLVATCMSIHELDMRFLNRVHVCEVSAPSKAEIELILHGMGPPEPSLLRPATAAGLRSSYAASSKPPWLSRFATVYSQIIHEMRGDEDAMDETTPGIRVAPAPLDAIRLARQVFAILTRVQGAIDEQVMQNETKRVLINYTGGMRETSTSGMLSNNTSPGNLWPLAATFGGPILHVSSDEVTEWTSKCVNRWMSDCEVLMPNVALVPELLRVFSEVSIFLSNDSPGCSGMLMTGSSGSGRKLALRAIAHEFAYDTLWYPRNKLTGKQVANELRNFSDFLSLASAATESSVEEVESKRILIIIEEEHLSHIACLGKYLYAFVRQEEARSPLPVSHGCASVTVKVAIVKNSPNNCSSLPYLSQADDSMWTRVLALRAFGTHFSPASLKVIPSLIDTQVDCDVADKLPLLLPKLYPGYLNFHPDKRRVLSLSATFALLFKEKKIYIQEQRKQFTEKIAKLESTSRQVEKLKQEAAHQKIVLAKKRQEADEALSAITSSMTASEDQRIELEQIKMLTEKETAKLSVRKQEIDEELSAIQPAITAAKDAVGAIKSESLSEIRSLRAPPEVIRDILEGVLRLMGVNDTSWVSMKSFLAQRGVKEEIINFDARKITPEMSAKVQELLKKKPASFDEKMAKRASAAAAPLAAWVRANLSFAVVLQKIKPLEDEQNRLQKGLKDAESRIKTLGSQLHGVETEVSKLKDRLNQVTLEAAQIEVSVKQTAETIEESERLVSELSGEDEHWRTQLAELDARLSSLSSKCLIAAAFVTCMGTRWTSGGARGQTAGNKSAARRSSWASSSQAMSDMRKQLVKECCAILGIEEFDVASFLECENEYQVFVKVKAPLVTCVLLDVKERMTGDTRTDYFTKSGSGNQQQQQVELCSFRSRDWPRVLELALRFGRTVILHSFTRLDLSLLSLLKHHLYGSQGSRTWTFLGDKRVDCHPNFNLILIPTREHTLYAEATLHHQEFDSSSTIKEENEDADAQEATERTCLDPVRSLLNVIDFS